MINLANVLGDIGDPARRRNRRGRQSGSGSLLRSLEAMRILAPRSQQVPDPGAG
jgi:hypothetical protein